MSNAFNVVFHGEIQEGKDNSQVRQRLTKLLRKKEEEIEKLFSGSPVIIKRGIEEQEATKYKQAIEKTGALCEIVPDDAIPDANKPQTAVLREELPQKPQPASSDQALTVKPSPMTPAIAREEEGMRYKEYKVILVVESGLSTLLLGAAGLPIKKMEVELNEAAAEGWQVVFQVIEKKRFLLFWTREAIIITLGR